MNIFPYIGRIRKTLDNIDEPLQTILQAISPDGITRSKLMKIVRIPANELDKYIQALVVMEKIRWELKKTGGRDAQVYYLISEK